MDINPSEQMDGDFMETQPAFRSEGAKKRRDKKPRREVEQLQFL